jgi:hypothetical protein
VATAPAIEPSVNTHVFIKSGTSEVGAVGGGLPEQVTDPKVGSEVKTTWEVFAVPTGQSARPDRVLFGAFNDPMFRLQKAIPLDVTVEEGHVVVNWAAVDEFGSGATLSAAIDDFAYALRALYRYLNSVKELGPDLANVKHVLGEHIKAR